MDTNLRFIHNEICGQIEDMNNILSSEKDIDHAYPGSVCAAYALYEIWAKDNDPDMFDKYTWVSAFERRIIFYCLFNFKNYGDRLELRSIDSHNNLSDVYEWNNGWWEEKE